MNKDDIMAYCQKLVHVFEVGLFRIIALKYRLSLADFSLGLHYVT